MSPRDVGQPTLDRGEGTTDYAGDQGDNRSGASRRHWTGEVVDVVVRARAISLSDVGSRSRTDDLYRRLT